MKVLKKHIEDGMRLAAANNGRKGRSITPEAVMRATKYGGEILQQFLDYIERSMPPLGGRGSRVQKQNVEIAYLRFSHHFQAALKEAENMLSEEEE